MGCIIKKIIPLVIPFMIALPGISRAMPTQYGDSGLVSVPTTEIAERGAFQAGAWLNHSEKGSSASVMPVSIAMGVIDGLELSASYPNLFLNGKNDQSLRGFENIGFKYRLIGDAFSNFKTAVSAFIRQTVSDDSNKNGLRDVGTRLMMSYRLAKTELNLNAGYLKVSSPSGVEYDNETLFGGAITYYVSERMKTFLELDGNTSRVKGSSRMEIAPGMQYYILPNVAFIGTIGTGMSDVGPDYRIVAGLTFTSGSLAYAKAIPVIPGSREKYAEASAVTPEELIPDLPVPSKETEVKPIIAPAPAAAEAVPAPPAPVPIPAPAPTPAPAPLVEKPVEKIEAAIPGTKKKVEILVEKDKIVVQGDVLFASGKSELTDSGKAVIARVAEAMKGITGLKEVKLEGHTDGSGTDAANERLSLKRAESVKDHLVKSGISGSIISATGYGKTKPIASNDTPEGRSKNRRVEILLVIGEK